MLPPDEYCRTGYDLARTRTLLGVSRGQLAARIGCRAATVQAWEACGYDAPVLTVVQAIRLKNTLKSFAFERLMRLHSENLDLSVIAGSEIEDLLYALTPEYMPKEQSI